MNAAGDSRVASRHRLHEVRSCILAAGALPLLFVTPANAGGSLAAHMAGHIALMNLLAPLIALVAIAYSPSELRRSLSRNRVLLWATISQIAALWASHTPTVLAFATSNGLSHTALQATLLLTALWFWGSVLSQPPRDFWRALLGLLFTGKLFCLLGVLLVFAPRSLYLLHSHDAHGGALVAGRTAIEDQQLAGLLMLLACPISYLLAGIVISSRALKALENDEERQRSSTAGMRQGWQR